MIEVENLSRTFGDRAVLKSISFRAVRGEIFGLLGSNGAGKTTTNRILCGLLRPTSGRARVMGNDVVENPMAARTAVGYLPEAPNLYERLTGGEFLRFAGKLRGLVGNRLERRVMELARVMDLHDALDVQIGAYSRGMKQKTAFAAALVSDPPVLVLDEPMAGLDARYARLFRRWLPEMARNGKTILLTTHGIHVAEALCARVAVLHAGAIKATGTPEELVERTSSKDLEEAFIKITGGEREWREGLSLPSLRRN